MRRARLHILAVLFNAATLLSLTLCVATVVSVARGGAGNLAHVLIGPYRVEIRPWLFLAMTALLPAWRLGLAIHDWRMARISVWICERCGNDVPLKRDRCSCDASPTRLDDGGRPVAVNAEARRKAS